MFFLKTTACIHIAQEGWKRCLIPCSPPCTSAGAQPGSLSPSMTTCRQGDVLLSMPANTLTNEMGQCLTPKPSANLLTVRALLQKMTNVGSDFPHVQGKSNFRHSALLSLQGSNSVPWVSPKVSCPMLCFQILILQEELKKKKKEVKILFTALFSFFNSLLAWGIKPAKVIILKVLSCLPKVLWEIQ